MRHTILLDWIEFTCLEDCEELTLENKKKIESWGFDLQKFKSLEKGLLGYKKRLWHNYTQILYHGNANMKTHIILSGKGVRSYELKKPAEDLIKMLTQDDVSFTRIDLAMDIKDGSIKFNELLQYLNKNYIVTRFKRYKYIVEKEINEFEQPVLGESIYFGSRASNIYVRIYDKAKQLEQSGDWIRIEICYKNDHANALALYLANELTKDKKTAGQLFSETLSNYIRFVEPSGTDSNKRRWKTAPFWKHILTSSQRLKLSFKGVEVDPDKAEQWITFQVAPTLAFLNKYWGGDMERLEKIITGAEERMSEGHRRILAMKEMKGEENADN